ncbi:hypothetical protein GCM10022237_30860 [Nocardioides ginsengisoli]|uniref:Carboxypeptidase regulatory-like domain-containing protein n=1 Tax=Nocardioides ginsengisoli TaxID=363868 RepID=A0ABW3VV75_9ACTN
MTRLRPALLTLLTALTGLTVPLLGATPAHAAGPSVQVLAIPWADCQQGSPPLQIETTGAADAQASLWVRVEADGLVYFQEKAPITSDGRRNWRPYARWDDVPDALRGTWPVPAGRQVRAELRLVGPDGATLDEWTTVIDGCDSGVMLFNGPSETDRDRDLVTTRYDLCPTVTAPRTTDGCPTIGRSVTLARTGRKVAGRLTAGNAVLARNQEVRLYRARAGADLLLASGRTDAVGRFRLTPGKLRGKVYAVAPGLLVPTIGRAQQATSPLVRLS